MPDLTPTAKVSCDGGGEVLKCINRRREVCPLKKQNRVNVVHNSLTELMMNDVTKIMWCASVGALAERGNID